MCTLHDRKLGWHPSALGRSPGLRAPLPSADSTALWPSHETRDGSCQLSLSGPVLILRSSVTAPPRERRISRKEGAKHIKTHNRIQYA
eukprot:4568669-Prymnesium_polylepis.1